MRINSFHKIDENRVNQIIEEMEILGAPTLRAIDTSYGLIAIEGNHRLEAAWRLEIEPEIIILEDDNEMIEHDIPDLPNPCSMADIRDYIDMPDQGKFYDFDEIY